MKKLLATAAVCGLVMAAAPAHAEVSVELGGYFKGYGAFVDQDENVSDVNGVDFVRDAEFHISGETTLDNGLTVGVHFELEADGDDSAKTIEETYAYFSGSWGRFNVGDEDGAGYLLQVAAPSADSNIDGIRQLINPINYAAETGVTAISDALNGLNGGDGLDYDMDITGKSTKLTYLSPVFSGFQVGLSFVPDSDGDAGDLDGIGLDDQNNTFGQAYELAARYEGQIDNIGFALGAGYAERELEANNGTAATDDQTAWNVGLDLDVGPFGFGVVYTEDDNGEVDVDSAAGGASVDDEETFVVGADYTSGAFKIGVSYLDSDNVGANNELEAERYTGGVTYTYGPGMTFRGSIGYVELEDDTNNFGTDDSTESTYIILGTQINF